MEIFSEINENNKQIALALGFFDGVHLGHQAVIKSAVDFARKNGKKSAVLTFKEHPQVLLKGVKPNYIMTENQRREAIANLGVDYCYELDFMSISKFSGVEYLKNILLKNFDPISISTGFNHFFGQNKSGNPELLEKLAQEFGYTYFKISPVVQSGEIVSSSLIRTCLTNGEVSKVNILKGSPFVVEGVVIKGKQIARKLGFKTANLDYPSTVVELPFGAYSVNTVVRGKKYKGMANFGVKPTVDNSSGKPILEVHILDFDEEIYGEKISVEFLDFLRYEQKYESLEALKTQLQKDLQAIL